MNSARILFFLFVFVGLSRPGLQAEGPEKDTLPTPPFVATPPWGSAWSVQFEFENVKRSKEKADAGSAEKAAPPDLPDRVYIQMGLNKVLRGTVLYSSGRKEVYFIFDGLLVQNFSNNSQVDISSAGSNADFLDATDPGVTPVLLRFGGFPGVGWLSLKTFQGIETIEKQLLFRYENVTPGVEGFPDIHRQAWVGVQGNYPYKVQINSTVLTFSAVAPYAQDVQLPNEFQKALQIRNAQLKALEALQNRQKSGR